LLPATIRGLSEVKANRELAENPLGFIPDAALCAAALCAAISEPKLGLNTLDPDGLPIPRHPEAAR